MFPQVQARGLMKSLETSADGSVVIRNSNKSHQRFDGQGDIVSNAPNSAGDSILPASSQVGHSMSQHLASTIEAAKLPPVRIHEDLHSHNIANFYRTNQASEVASSKPHVGILSQGARTTIKELPPWAIPLLAAGILVILGFTGMSQGWFDIHNLDMGIRDGQEDRTVSKTPAGSKACCVADVGRANACPEDSPSLHSPRASTLEKMLHQKESQLSRPKTAEHCRDNANHA